MIGTGCDIVAISRIEKIARKYKKSFLNKFLNQKEQEILMKNSCSYKNLEWHNFNFATLAGLFAAKEAAAKALGVGISKECSFFDIQISKNHLNAPQLDFSSSIKKKFHIQSASISISHEKEFAIAVAVLNYER